MNLVNLLFSSLLRNENFSQERGSGCQKKQECRRGGKAVLERIFSLCSGRAGPVYITCAALEFHAEL